MAVAIVKLPYMGKPIDNVGEFEQPYKSIEIPFSSVISFVFNFLGAIHGPHSCSPA